MLKKIIAVLLLTCMHTTIFSMCSPCTITEVAGSPFASSNNPAALSFSPRCNLLAVPNDINTTIYTVNSDCTLTFKTTLPVVGTNGSNVAFLQMVTVSL